MAHSRYQTPEAKGFIIGQLSLLSGCLGSRRLRPLTRPATTSSFYTTMPESLKFTIVDAFTVRRFGGSPAGVIVVPLGESCPESTTLQGIALELNVPATAFVTHSEGPASTDGSGHVSFGLRWFTPEKEIAICGHATLASASVLFAEPTLVPPDVNEIRFSTRSGVMTARRVSGSSRIELTFPVGDIVPADQDTVSSASRLVPVAIKDEDATINFVGVGSGPPYDRSVLIDLDLKRDLSRYNVDATILVRTRERSQPRLTNVL